MKAPGTPEELRLRGAVTGAWKGLVTGDTSRYNVEATIEQDGCRSRSNGQVPGTKLHIQLD